MLSGRVAFGLTVVALLYSLALLTWVVTEPWFEAWTFVIVLQPLVVTAVVWQLLHARCSTGSRVATTAAWLVVSLFFVWSVLGALTLAAGAFPAAFLLLLAAATTPKPRAAV
jgi:hypothetical protein